VYNEFETRFVIETGIFAMRKLWLILLVCGLLMASGVASAQTEAPPVPVQAPTIPDLTQFDERATQLTDLVETAQQQIDNVFNLLGLFEALGVTITVVGGAAALFGVTRFISAQNQLKEAREGFEREMVASRERLEQQSQEKEAQLDYLRTELKRSTSNATLALSYLPLGESQYRTGDFPGAVDIYRRALELDNNNPVIHYRMGYVLTQYGKLEDAEKHLKAALEIEPEFAPALASLGYVYRRRGEKLPEGIERASHLSKAESLLVQALDLSPRLVDEEGESWWGSLGGLYRRRGQINEAIYAYNQAAIVIPKSSYAFSNLALLYTQQNDRAKMLETYQHVRSLAQAEVQADVNNYWAYADLLTARLALGDTDNLQSLIHSLFVTAPMDSAYALESLIEALQRLGKVLADDPTRKQSIDDTIDRINQHIVSATAQIRRDAVTKAMPKDESD
jgi:tetratricopeptide (TPR) repeat protein